MLGGLELGVQCLGCEHSSWTVDPYTAVAVVISLLHVSCIGPDCPPNETRYKALGMQRAMMMCRDLLNPILCCFVLLSSFHLKSHLFGDLK